MFRLLINYINLLELQWRKAPPCSSWDTGRVAPLVVVVCLQKEQCYSQTEYLLVLNKGNFVSHRGFEFFNNLHFIGKKCQQQTNRLTVTLLILDIQFLVGPTSKANDNKIGHSSRSSSIQRSEITEEVSGNVKNF